MLTSGSNNGKLKTPGRPEGIVVKNQLVGHILEKNILSAEYIRGICANPPVGEKRKSRHKRGRSDFSRRLVPA
jgi:hypothetical protein